MTVSFELTGTPALWRDVSLEEAGAGGRFGTSTEATMILAEVVMVKKLSKPPNQLSPVQLLRIQNGDDRN